jgi:hypothetical protein
MCARFDRYYPGDAGTSQQNTAKRIAKAGQSMPIMPVAPRCRWLRWYFAGPVRTFAKIEADRNSAFVLIITFGELSESRRDLRALCV